MKAKEKAIELIKKMYLFTSGDSGKDDLTWANAKQCALIAVDEILNAIQDLECENVNWTIGKKSKKK